MQSSKGAFPKEQNPNVPTKVNVNQEYMQALRTKSYTDIWTKVHGDPEQRPPSDVDPDQPPQVPAAAGTTPTAHRGGPNNLSSSSDLLEPRQETLMAVGHDAHLHALLLDYFERSAEAFHICAALLLNIDQTRSNYRLIQRILTRVKQRDDDDRCYYSEDQCRFISGELAAFARLENPLSCSSLVQFRRVHDLHASLLHRLTSTRKKVLRRAKTIRLVKKASGVGLLVAFGALNVGLVVVAAHTIVGLASIPVLVCQSVALVREKKKWVRGRCDSLGRVGAQLDAAARGAYILDRDLETMSRLVRRLHDEIEHSKAMIEICLRSPRGYLLREVVKEFESGEGVFLEQLKELEEHVYLCFLTINRARRLVVQQLSFKQRNTLDGTASSPTS
ncbi:hypothetical protein H6P81_018665 [Aristolochia fimbriata]|uniref:Uncharacterized protein n=1 Tax=Aristolochia fimbriata TaxID=158543 RepID=A0AAV7E4P3_ARIFI|nr:hypothetical protein H6P81_018665 [Aristolochia fimbriata]